jgi:protein-tyrosine phosphatase
MINQIDSFPIRPGWGKIYQSGVIASLDSDLDGLTVSMSGNENFKPPVLWIDIPDNDEYILPFPILWAMCDAIVAFLAQGKDVLIHCNEGKYRSTYMDVAVHIRAGQSFDVAYSNIQAHHPIAELRQGTRKQLQEVSHA